MNESEFERCVRQHLNSVYLTALYYLKNKSDAEDVAQDVFFKLCTYNGDFSDDAHLKAWLLKCAANESKNLLRSHWYKYSLPLETAGELPDPGASGFTDTDNELLGALDSLGRNNRVVLYMFYYEGYSIAETAQILGISERAVSSRLRRGRKQLKALLESGKESETI